MTRQAKKCSGSSEAKLCSHRTLAASGEVEGETLQREQGGPVSGKEGEQGVMFQHPWLTQPVSEAQTILNIL